MGKQKKRVNGELTNLYQIDRQVLSDRHLIQEASDRKYQMALIENPPNKESNVPPIPINIETDKVGVEHLKFAVEEQID